MRHSFDSEVVADFSFLRCGTTVVMQRAREDTVSLLNALREYLEIECMAEELPAATVKDFAKASCDERREWGEVIEPWKFRHLRQSWGYPIPYANNGRHISD